jgi:hypothetical protein
MALIQYPDTWERICSGDYVSSFALVVRRYPEKLSTISAADAYESFVNTFDWCDHNIEEQGFFVWWNSAIAPSLK